MPSLTTILASTYNSTEFGVPQPGTTPPKYAWLGANGLASDEDDQHICVLAVAGGADYIPSIAGSTPRKPNIRRARSEPTASA
jgi:hypothetical protein